MNDQPLVSICIPVYYSGPGVPRVLAELVDSINEQDYARIIIAASVQKCDPLERSAILDALRRSKCRRQVIYPNAEVDGPAKNTNSAVQLVREGYVKIMNQDDFFDSPTAISEMVEMLEGSEHRWLANTCVHTDSPGVQRERIHVPRWPGEKGMVEGINRIGCPSVSMIHSSIIPQCDPNLVLCLDCDMWIQLYRKAGVPIIRNIPDVVIRGWEGNLSKQINYAQSLETDKIYMRKKYGYV